MKVFRLRPTQTDAIFRVRRHIVVMDDGDIFRDSGGFTGCGFHGGIMVGNPTVVEFLMGLRSIQAVFNDFSLL
jgi:hypothetical protein